MNGDISGAMSALDALVGEWAMEGSIEGRTLARAKMVFEWIEGGLFVRERGEAEPALPETPPEWIANSPFPTTAMIGLDAATGAFSFLHGDRRGVRRVYRMTLDTRTWTLEGSTENGYQQKFTGHFDAEQSRITAKWESSQDGEVWRHDFDETYTKLS